MDRNQKRQIAGGVVAVADRAFQREGGGVDLTSAVINDNVQVENVVLPAANLVSETGSTLTASRTCGYSESPHLVGTPITFQEQGRPCQGDPWVAITRCRL